MTLKSSAIMLALLPLLANTAAAGRRAVAPKAAEPLFPDAKQSTLDLAAWSKSVNARIVSSRVAATGKAGSLAKLKPMTMPPASAPLPVTPVSSVSAPLPVIPVSSVIPVSNPVVTNPVVTSPPAVVAAAPIAQAPVPPSRHDKADGPPVVILLTPKPVISSF